MFLFVEKQAGSSNREKKATAIVNVDTDAGDFKACEKTCFQDVGRTGDCT